MRGQRLPRGRDEKPCSRCGRTKPLTEFSYHAGVSDGRQARCRECQAELARAHRERQSPAGTAAERLRAEARRRVRTEAVYRYLMTHPCVDCGEADPVVLEFDHVYGVKRAPISTMLRGHSWANIMAEIDKCEVRCANCHRRKTAVQFGWYAYQGEDHRREAERLARRLLDEASGALPLFEDLLTGDN